MYTEVYIYVRTNSLTKNHIYVPMNSNTPVNTHKLTHTYTNTYIHVHTHTTTHVLT